MITVESQAAVRSAPVLPLNTALGAARIAVSDRDPAGNLVKLVVG